MAVLPACGTGEEIESFMGEAIEQTLCGLLKKVDGVTQDIQADADLLSDLSLESVQVIEFVMEIEDHYDIIIAEQKLADVRTIAQLARVVADELS